MTDAEYENMKREALRLLDSTDDRSIPIANVIVKMMIADRLDKILKWLEE